MPEVTIQQALALGIEHHRGGRLAQAEAVYREILAQYPQNSDAWYNLGIALAAKGLHAAAADAFQNAARICPDRPDIHNDLGNSLCALGRSADAEQCFHRALQLDPNSVDAHGQIGVLYASLHRYPEAIAHYQQALRIAPRHPMLHFNLGVSLAELGRSEDAVTFYRQAIQLQPDHFAAHNNLANVLRSLGRHQEAIDHYQRALQIKPDFAEGSYNLANIFEFLGRADEAITAYRRALQFQPDHFEACNNLANILKDLDRLPEAIEFYHKALHIKPDFAEASYNLANILKLLGRSDEAIAAYRRAIQLKPDYFASYNNLANLFSDIGLHDQALATYRQALAQQPDNASVHSNLLYDLHFHPAYDAQAIAAEHRCWHRHHAEPLKKFLQPHSNDRHPDRRLRIGYVSPDFFFHAESFFTVPLLENHDHSAYQIHCYSSVLKPDEITARLRPCADVWRDVRDRPDEALASLIRQDRIDILVDLTMHMARNRALLFARKPAPLQVCWLAYPGGTGLETMDYRLTDSWMDPLDADTSCYVEQSIRLPDCWVVYDPLIDLPPRPPEQSGPITFGSLNSPKKLNEPLLALWGSVLKETPGSRLLLLVPSLEHRRRIGRFLEHLGIAPERLQFVGSLPRALYFRSYDQIDIALDPLPYNGITTTCDALYMGVPVLTLAGATAAGRAGKAMLTTIGMRELVAHTPAEFVQKAVQLATDLPRLTAMRRGLRQRLATSPLMDAPAFTRAFESALRHMWQTWCASSPSPPRR